MKEAPQEFLVSLVGRTSVIQEAAEEAAEEAEAEDAADEGAEEAPGEPARAREYRHSWIRNGSFLLLLFTSDFSFFLFYCFLLFSFRLLCFLSIVASGIHDLPPSWERLEKRCFGASGSACSSSCGLHRDNR